jgi:uncharacterized Ntn-hydrolase superfamily protein
MTYSIIARDPATGELGIAVQSRYFAAGRHVPFVEAGVGVVASQAFANPGHGPEALRLLRAGLDPSSVVERLVSEDPGAAVRQLAIVDTRGRFAVHTGAGCVAAAGHTIGVDCSAQANMMTRDTVWPAMARAFENSGGGIADRLLAALEAAEREGGDVRGRQAAALIVVAKESAAGPPFDRSVDLRVDDHRDPVGEIRRLLEYSRAHKRANRAIDKISANDFVGALADLDASCEAFPDDAEFAVRRALVLLALRRMDEARAELRHAHDIHGGSIEAVLRFADAGVIPIGRGMLEPLMSDFRPPSDSPRSSGRPRHASAGTPAA